MSTSELLTTQKIILLSEHDNKTCATFSIENEDHTIGNLLRWMLMKDERVEFAAYSIPHPSDNRIHLRIQTAEHPASLVLDDAFTNLLQIVDHMETTWQEAVVNF
eukprot:NODE_191_length_13422_cov_1.451025.p12 type:complete len:105 gc:universal NODE_191_length_13422_cov_1.451025:640-326(-)